MLAAVDRGAAYPEISRILGVLLATIGRHVKPQGKRKRETAEVAPRHSEEKVKVAVAVLTVPDGPEGSRVVSGTVVSTITVRALDAAEVLPAASVALAV